MSSHPERIGPYQITAKLGEGGMGIVYHAQDTRLNRAVALKMIRDQGADEDLRKRFLREAQSAARVSHPSICRLYDIGEEDGRPFLVMELLEGESLACRLTRGPIEFAEAVQIALSMLSALAALHRCSILHRDLKPSNVFLSTQGVKLLDFGLAKTIAPELDPNAKTATEITREGVIAATPRYASPEQITGKPLDARSDLFSIAAVLFEMLTGKYAFTGDSAVAIFHAILYDSPPTLSGSPGVAAVDRVVQRALSKNPEDRFREADEMAAELRASLQLAALQSETTGTHVETRTMKRLIVLPFRALRSDPDTDFLAFSLPDAIAASLAGLSSLVVRSSLAAARFAGPAPDLKEIAKEADVDVVLTGTLLRAGTQLRLATQLVEAPSGTLIWSRSSQVELHDIFQLQDTLVSGVVESLALPLTTGDRQLLAHDAPASASAYDLYLRANELSRNRDDISGAIKLYEQCVAKDPQYAPAWARLGRTRWLADKYAAASSKKIAEADAALRRALELNPDLPLAHNFYTHIQVEEGRALDAMTRLLRRSRDTRNDPELFAGLTHAFRYCGLLDASLAAHQQARRLDPHIVTTVIQTHFMLGDYKGALEASKGDYGYSIAASLAMLGRVDEAIAILQERENLSWHLGKLYLVALRALLEGDRDTSLRASDELLAGTFRDPEGWYYLARQLSYMSEADRAFIALGKCADGFYCYSALASDPWLDPLRGYPAFKQILRKTQMQYQEALAVFQAEGGPALLGVFQ
ncbi:MAG TPA: protein kinase [Bryobacteraceae bacterium]|jgi:serine/threonine protein kinase|nr:protein kinase [Bryobacteraceae bacterium]